MLRVTPKITSLLDGHGRHQNVTPGQEVVAILMSDLHVHEFIHSSWATLANSLSRSSALTALGSTSGACVSLRINEELPCLRAWLGLRATVGSVRQRGAPGLNVMSMAQMVCTCLRIRLLACYHARCFVVLLCVGMRSLRGRTFGSSCSCFWLVLVEPRAIPFFV